MVTPKLRIIAQSVRRIRAITGAIVRFLQDKCEVVAMDTLDKIDRQILRTLQADGRATYEQIAEQVSLSPSSVLRRVKRLEESEVIDGYVALVNPKP